MNILSKIFPCIFKAESTVAKEDAAKVESTTPPWMTEAKKYDGKKENDPAFNKEMSKKWSLFGMNLGTIQENWAAWCGLFVAAALSGAGIKYAQDGAEARKWASYGVAVEYRTQGIPKGAIVHINHNADCDSDSSNHVTFANGDCTPDDVNRKNASFDGYGGNQENTAKVSTYPISHICEVRWPKDYPMRGKILKSDHCTSDRSAQESTR